MCLFMLLLMDEPLKVTRSAGLARAASNCANSCRGQGLNRGRERFSAYFGAAPVLRNRYPTTFRDHFTLAFSWTVVMGALYIRFRSRFPSAHLPSGCSYSLRTGTIRRVPHLSRSERWDLDVQAVSSKFLVRGKSSGLRELAEDLNRA